MRNRMVEPVHSGGNSKGGREDEEGVPAKAYRHTVPSMSASRTQLEVRRGDRWAYLAKAGSCRQHSCFLIRCPSLV